MSKCMWKISKWSSSLSSSSSSSSSQSSSSSSSLSLTYCARKQKQTSVFDLVIWTLVWLCMTRVRDRFVKGSHTHTHTRTRTHTHAHTQLMELNRPTRHDFKKVFVIWGGAVVRWLVRWRRLLVTRKERVGLHTLHVTSLRYGEPLKAPGF